MQMQLYDFETGAPFDVCYVWPSADSRKAIKRIEGEKQLALAALAGEYKDVLDANRLSEKERVDALIADLNLATRNMQFQNTQQEIMDRALLSIARLSIARAPLTPAQRSLVDAAVDDPFWQEQDFEGVTKLADTFSRANRLGRQGHYKDTKLAGVPPAADPEAGDDPPAGPAGEAPMGTVAGAG